MAKQSGYVYLIECNGYFKVGKATSIESRMNQLQIGSPHEMKLVASFKSKDYSKDERLIHKMLADFNVRGEWFSIPTEKMALLNEWFVTSVRNNDSAIGTQHDVRQKSVGFVEWATRYKTDEGYEELIKDLCEKQLFAFHFIRQYPEYVIEQAVKHGDDYTLFRIYCMLVDSNFALPSIQDFEPRFIESIERFKSNMSWVAALSAAIHCFY